MKVHRLGPLMVLAVSGCASLSAIHPPGRHDDTYSACLDQHMAFPDAADTSRKGLGELAVAMVRGDAFTRDATNLFMRDTLKPDAPPKPYDLTTIEGLRAVESAPFQQFLDCFLGPVDPIDYDTRLLRGHIALAMLSEYAAHEIAEAPISKRKDYANTAISQISGAELSLKSMSYAEANQVWGTGGSASGSKAKLITRMPGTPVQSVRNVARIEQIIKLAAFSDTVAFRNAWGGMVQLVADSASHLTAAAVAQDAANSAVKALQEAATVNAFGAAYFQESALYLAAITGCAPHSVANSPDMCSSTDSSATTPALAVSNLLSFKDQGNAADCKATPNDKLCLRHAAWMRWDVSITDACTKLSGMAENATTPNCVPTNDQLEKAPSVWLMPSGQ